MITDDGTLFNVAMRLEPRLLIEMDFDPPVHFLEDIVRRRDRKFGLSHSPAAESESRNAVPDQSLLNE